MARLLEAYAVTCPYCGSGPGQPCYLWAQHKTLGSPHPSRTTAGRATADTPRAVDALS